MGPASFNHGLHGEIVNALDGLVLIEMVVPLEHGRDLLRFLQDVPNAGRTFDGLMIFKIQTMVNKH